MLKGCLSAKIDDKGRLKVPSGFRAYMQDKGPELFVTSLTGEWVLVYPMAAWEALEPQLSELPSALRRFNYYGQAAELDNQGRVLIPPRLRDSALMNGDVEVFGQLNHLEVWNHDRYVNTMLSVPVTDEERAALKKLGI